jgi:hypothetical protein
MDGKSVYHFEHFRGDDSWVTNTHFNSNWGVFENIKAMSNTDLVSHYLNPEYAGKYTNICKIGTTI